MNGELNHASVRDLLGAYALDAVDADERTAVELHMRYCLPCRAEVADHLAVAGLLTSAWLPAPDGVWDRIVGSLEEAPPALGLPGVIPIDRRSRGMGYRAAAAVAVVAAGVIGVLGAKLVDTDRQLDDLAVVLGADELQRAAIAAAADPGARLVSLRSGDSRLTADAVLLADGTGYLMANNLPSLPPDRTYQLWAVVGDDAVSVGVLGPTPARAAFKAAGDVSALAITEEVAGGVVSSRHPPSLVGVVA